MRQNKPHLNKLFGFTLVELMVVISILAIILSIAAPSYTTFIANTQIRSTAESIRNGMQVARAEAVKRNATVMFTLSNDTSWTVTCPVITENCPASIQSKPAKESSSSSTILSATGNISFTSLGLRTAAAGQLSAVNIDSSAIPSTSSKDLRITVGAGGNVRVCDPNISVTTDVRYCS